MKEIKISGYEFEINTCDLLTQLSQYYSVLLSAIRSNDDIALSAAVLPFVGIVSCISVKSSRTQVLEKFIRKSLSRALCNALKLIAPEKLTHLQRVILKKEVKPVRKKILMDLNLFSRPGSSTVSNAYLDQICAALEDFDQDMSTEIQQIRIAWPSLFSRGTSEEWSSSREYYDELSNDSICGPMQPYLDALDKEALYKQKLCTRLTDGLYDGSCSIQDIYIDLYATYQHEHTDTVETRTCRLEKSLIEWATSKDPGMIVVEGDPGSGKSTILKKVAKELICCGKHVIYIDLYKLPFSTRTSCITTLEDYLKTLPWYLSLDIASDSNTVYILDGLDEIRSNVWENAQDLTESLPLTPLCTHQKVILSGRIKIISHCAKELSRLDRYTILPLDYADSPNDQRKELWKKLSNIYDLNISINDLLKHDHLKELSGSPLLMFLLAWTFDKDPSSLERVSNSVQLYRLILKFVYERRHNRDERNYAGDANDYKSYFKILRAVGACAWLHNSRAIEVSRIEEYCHAMDIEKEYICWFKEEKKQRISRLFLLFFAHELQSEKDESIFEFLHKSFYEYLALEEIIYHINHLRMLESNTAVERLWYLLCEQNIASDPMFDFMDALITENPDEFQAFTENLQYTFSLIKLENINLSTLLYPQTGPLLIKQDLKELITKFDNVRNNLWQFVGYVFTTAENHPELIANNRFSFSGMKFEHQNIPVAKLPNADFSECTFDEVLMPLSSLPNSLWKHTSVFKGIFPGSFFDKGSFENVQVLSCSFETASFTGSHFVDGHFDCCRFGASYFCEALIQKSVFTDCDFTSANWDEAKLSECSFNNCFFDRADFTDAMISNCHFTDCSFSDAILTGVKLAGFDLSDSALIEALSEANLENANYEGIAEETWKELHSDI